MPTHTVHTDDHGRLLAHIDLSYQDEGTYQHEHATEDFTLADGVEPNVVSSRTVIGTHKPIFDLDFPCRLVESSSPGKFHLYLDGIELTEKQYEHVLRTLENVGIVQHGWTKHLHGKARAVFLRLPGVRKSQKQIDREAKFPRAVPEGF